MIPRQSLSESWPALYEPVDLQTVLEAALGIVVRAWRWGVLVAFVVDGKFEAAVSLIADYVTRDEPPHLLSGFEPAGRPPRRHLFQTLHRQGGGSQRIRLLHLFLPFPPRQP